MIYLRFGLVAGGVATAGAFGFAAVAGSVTETLTLGAVAGGVTAEVFCGTLVAGCVIVIFRMALLLYDQIHLSFQEELCLDLRVLVLQPALDQ